MAGITDLEFKWVPGVATDVSHTWRRFGWTPPSEQEAFQTKWKKYRGNYETDSVSTSKSTEVIWTGAKNKRQPTL